VPFDPHAETVSRIVLVLREERHRQRISEETLAQLAGMSRGGIRHVESGQFRPTLYTLLKMAEALGLDFLSLLKKAQTGIPEKPRSRGRPR
jgi:transcriptional regulator with XRE-family HTH domain